jgi:hypothetical protein
VLAGVPILNLFRRAQHASWNAHSEPRTPYDPWGQVAGAEASGSTRPSADARDAAAPPRAATPTSRPDFAPVPSALSPQLDSTAPRPAPVAPPVFDIPRPTRSDAPKKRRRRRPKRGGAPHA